MTKIIKQVFLLASLTILLPIVCHGQTLEMNFPAFAGKTYEFLIFQGDQTIKVVDNDSIPADGKFTLKIPRMYAPYTGMCRWLLTNNKEGGGLDMSIPGHGFSVSCMSATPNDSNLVYTGYDPVNELNRLSSKQRLIIEKYKVMAQAMKLYEKRSSSYAVFEKEMKLQHQAFDDFISSLKKNDHYAAHFLPILNILNGIPPHLTDDYGEGRKDVLRYISSELDMDALYTSGHWSAVLDTWGEIETNIIKDDMELVNSFISIGERIRDPLEYRDFVKNVTTFLVRKGKDNAIAMITPFVVNSGKITNYAGVLSVYQTELLGKHAPDLLVTVKSDQGDVQNRTLSMAATSGYNKTLVIFYESGCGMCDQLVHQDLPAKYNALKSAGIRIITLSADENEDTFKKTSHDFLWTDSYCDLKGFDGVNFKKYSVVGTPTVFLMDKDGVVESRLATMREIVDLLKKDGIEIN